MHDEHALRHELDLLQANYRTCQASLAHYEHSDVVLKNRIAELRAQIAQLQRQLSDLRAA